jgi:hypothetical protein
VVRLGSHLYFQAQLSDLPSVRALTMRAGVIRDTLVRHRPFHLTAPSTFALDGVYLGVCTLRRNLVLELWHCHACAALRLILGETASNHADRDLRQEGVLLQVSVKLLGLV